MRVKETEIPMLHFLQYMLLFIILLLTETVDET